MKTHILHLNQHDDIVSARDKMGWGKSKRILLVWPESGNCLNRRLDLLLLQRHSESMGAQLGIVSRDPEVRYHAPRLGIPVFKTLRKAQSAHWRTPRRFRRSSNATLDIDPEHIKEQETTSESRKIPERPPTTMTQPGPIVRLLVFTLGVAAFLSLVALLLPTAEVKLAPEIQSQSIEISVHASPLVDLVSISGEVPAHWQSVIVEGRNSLPVSGSVRVPDRPASGEVHFTNLTNQTVEIPVDTIVSNLGPDRVRFSVTQSGSVPAGSGATLSLPVRCLTPGIKGNLPANSLVALESVLGTMVNVTNPETTKYGADRREPATNQDDRDLLAENIQQALHKTALGELQNSIAPSDILLPSSIELVQVLEADYQPVDDTPTDLLQLNLRLEFRALVIQDVDVQELGRMVLNASLLPGFRALETTFQVEKLTPPTLEENTIVSWKITASRQTQVVISESQAIQLSLGQRPEDASSILMAAMPLSGPPHITVSPEWWPRLPILPFRFTILEPDI